jgi:predicted metalloprotease with PDZ domain
LAERTLPSPSRYDADGRLRAVVHPTTFTGVTDAAFNQIRQYGRGSAAVTIRLLEAIAGVAARASREEDRAALLQQARMIKRGSEAAIPEERDRRDVEAWYRAVERARRALVVDVQPNSPAEGAGIQRGDVIVGFRGEEIEAVHELPHVVATTPPGTEVDLRLISQGEERKVQVNVAEMPEE